MVINIFLLKSNAMKIIGEIDDKPKIILFINFIVCLVHMKRCHTSPSYIIKHWMCRKWLRNEMILLNNKSEIFGIQSIFICWCVKAIVFIGWKMSGFNSWCDWIFESRRNVLVWMWEFNICDKSIGWSEDVATASIAWHQQRQAQIQQMIHKHPKGWQKD